MSIDHISDLCRKSHEMRTLPDVDICSHKDRIGVAHDDLQLGKASADRAAFESWKGLCYIEHRGRAVPKTLSKEHRHEAGVTLLCFKGMAHLVVVLSLKLVCGF